MSVSVRSGTVKKVPVKYAPVLFAFLMSGMMAVLMSGVLTFINLGPIPEFGWLWLRGCAVGWVVAFPIALLVVPAVRRAVHLMTSG